MIGDWLDYSKPIFKKTRVYFDCQGIVKEHRAAGLPGFYCSLVSGRLMGVPNRKTKCISYYFDFE
jgi:hypothetical protein